MFDRNARPDKESAGAAGAVNLIELAAILMHTAFAMSLSTRVPQSEMSDSTARLLAEGATWLATGEVVRDEAEPFDRFMNRFEAVVPVHQRYEWLVLPCDELDGHTPLEYLDKDELEPLQIVVDAMPEQNHSLSGRS